MSPTPSPIFAQTAAQTAAPPDAQPPAKAERAAAPESSAARPLLRPLSRAWRWAILGYAAFILAGVAVAMLMTGGPGSGRLAGVAGILQQPYLQMLDAYRGQDDVSPDVDFVVYESEDEAQQGLRDFLQGRQDMRYVSKGLLPGVSVVRIRKDGLKASLDELNRQPFVNLVLKSRVGMICH
jgi:hypothetical protein